MKIRTSLLMLAFCLLAVSAFAANDALMGIWKLNESKSKLAAGGELKVIVDHRPAVPDIKRNAEEIGDEVLSTRETEEGVWEMVLRRCAR